MTQVTVRPADSADIPALAALRLAYLTEDCGGYPREIAARLEPYFSAHLGQDCFAVLGVTGTGEAVAAALLVCSEMPPNGHFPHGKRGTVYSVYTAPAYRRQGIGAEMLSLILQTAKEQGIDCVQLSATEAGKKLYEKAGFVCRKSHYTEMEYTFPQ